MAGFAKPGELLIFTLANLKPIELIAPLGLSECWIKDFDFSRNKKFAFCGTHSISKIVFKLDLKKKIKMGSQLGGSIKRIQAQ